MDPVESRDLRHRLRTMTGRDPDENHRVATPLELLFDLAFAAGFGIAGEQFAHVLAEGHVLAGLGAFALAMFAMIWAWINFTWFASAFDTDDWFFRVTTMVQMVGVVVVALGVPDVFHSLDTGHGLDNGVVVAGYVVMRVAMVAQWLRLAAQSVQHRRIALTYAGVVLLAQVGWVVLALTRLDLGPTLAVAAVLFLVELGGPLFAELNGGGTPWHPHHIAERYGLLTIIALGEGVLGTIASVQPVVAGEGWSSDAIVLVAAGILLTFGMWWVYFAAPFGHLLKLRRSASFIFGYLHLVVFAAVAAVGAGLHLAAYVVEGSAEVGVPDAVRAVAVPVGIFLVGLIVIYQLMARTWDGYLVGVLVLVVAVLVLAVVLSASGAGFATCVTIVALAPALVVAGFEIGGHRRVAAHLHRLGGGATITGP